MAENNRKISTTDDMCLTKVNFRKCTYLWVIEDYSVHDERNEFLYSLPFSAGDDEFKWQLCLHPHSDTDDDEEEEETAWISLELKTVGTFASLSRHRPITVNLQLSILNSENKETCIQNEKFKMTSGPLYVGFENFITRNTLVNEESLLLPDDRLTIYCELSYLKATDIVNISAKPFSESNEAAEPECLDGIESLFCNEEFSDVTLVVEGKKYPAHKSILVARSPVFRAAFTHDMEEKQTNIIEIKDITKAAFKEMLRYIYTGKVKNMQKSAPELLAAADKYDLKNLKVKCEKELYQKLSLETVVNTLMLADMYHATNLKKQALLYIKIHSCASDVLDEENRKSLTSHPHLLLEIIDTLAKKSNSGAKK